MYRTTFVRGAEAPGGGRGFLADQRSGRHLPASHTINGVVHEENGDFFAAIRSMHDFRRANRSQVAIALIRDNHLVGTSSLDSRGCRGRAAVRCLNIANIKSCLGSRSFARVLGFPRALMRFEFVRFEVD